MEPPTECAPFGRCGGGAPRAAASDERRVAGGGGVMGLSSKAAIGCSSMEQQVSGQRSVKGPADGWPGRVAVTPVRLPAAVRLRPASCDDGPGIAALLSASWHQAYDPLIGAEAVERRLRSLARLSLDDTDPGLGICRRRVVAEVSGRIAGLISTHRASGDRTMFIGMLYVAPDLQRRGLGRALLDHEMLKAPVQARFQLEVVPENTPALAFYSAMGFTTVRTAWSLRSWRRVTVMERGLGSECVDVRDLASAA